VTRFPGGPATSPGFLLWHVTLRWQRAVADALRPLDLTHVQFVLLACVWWLQEHDEVPNQARLAAQAGTDIKMTSQVVRKLEAKRLLRREVDVADSRARRLRLTDAGGRVTTRALAAVEKADAEFFGDAAPVLAPVLRRLADVSE
jgi:DNA-binding MarR family transcriptional regulator